MTDSVGVTVTCPACHAATAVPTNARVLRCACGHASNFIQCRKCGAATQQLQAHFGTPVRCPRCSVVDGSPKSTSAQVWVGMHGEATEPAPGLIASATDSTAGVASVDPLQPWRAWALARPWDEPGHAVTGAALGVIAVGLGAQGTAEVDAFVSSGRPYVDNLDAPASLDELDATVITGVLTQLLTAGWQPPNRATQGVALLPGERVWSTSPHERWVYKGQPTTYRRGSFIAFGNPLLLAATAIGSAAVSSASKAAANRRAAEQWRFGGRGNMSITSHRILLQEAALVPIALNTLQLAQQEGDAIQIVLSSGTPVMLQVPSGADLQFAVLESAMGRLQAPTERAAPVPPAAQTAVGSPSLLSPDAQHWWDGMQWIPVAQQLPPHGVRSPDGSQWHDGSEWRPISSPREVKPADTDRAPGDAPPPN